MAAEAAAKAEKERVEITAKEFVEETWNKVIKIAAAEKVWLDDEKWRLTEAKRL